ncbi:MAG: hypothetical protein JW940_02005 [Polyangiaceae bacterium]|nr:hypothetical protein [Polyangiaceae bacterium]
MASPAPPRPDLLSRLSFGAQLAVSYLPETHSSRTLVAPVLQARVDVTSHIAVDLEEPFAVERDSERASAARSGNPWIKGWYRDATDRLRWQLGAGVSLPLATVHIGPDGRIQRGLYNLSAAAWGLWDDWRWTPDRLAVPAVGGFSYRLTPRWALTGELGLAPVIGTRNGESGTHLLAQGAAGARVRFAHQLYLCPRVQGVLLPSTSVDRLQTAAGLRVEWTPGQRRFFLGALVNLDEPLGVIGRGTRSWAIHLGKELGL